MYISSKAFESLEYIGEGTEGVVRRSGNMALKKFYELSAYKKVCLDFQYKIPTKYFVFPNEKLYISKNYIGCTNDFISGCTLDNFEFDTFATLLPLIKNVEGELDEISSHKVTILDLNLKNAVICDDGFRVIDTTKYQITDDTYIAKAQNIRALNSFFIHLLLLNGIPEEKLINIMSDKLIGYYCSLSYIEAKNLFSKFLEYFLEECKVETHEQYKMKVKSAHK